MGYFTILAAIPGFFLSSVFLWLLWGPVSGQIGLGHVDITYVTAMLINITLWIAVAPLATAQRKKR